MSGRYTKAELLTALWKLSTDDERIPTSHGILDRALRDCHDSLPEALKNGLSFGVTGQIAVANGLSSAQAKDIGRQLLERVHQVKDQLNDELTERSVA